MAVADRPEEFPDFTQFYIDSAPDGDTLKLYALMDQAGFRGIAVDRDLAGRERVISGMLAEASVTGGAGDG